MTPIEIFSIVKEHLLKQNAKAINKYETCQYRTEQGLKCAVGCLILDEEYIEDMENMPVRSLKAKKLLPARLSPHVDLLSRLQVLHDVKPVDTWENSLNFIEKHIKEGFYDIED